MGLSPFVPGGCRSSESCLNAGLVSPFGREKTNIPASQLLISVWTGMNQLLSWRKWNRNWHEENVLPAAAEAARVVKSWGFFGPSETSILGHIILFNSWTWYKNLASLYCFNITLFKCMKGNVMKGCLNFSSESWHTFRKENQNTSTVSKCCSCFFLVPYHKQHSVVSEQFKFLMTWAFFFFFNFEFCTE